MTYERRGWNGFDGHHEGDHGWSPRISPGKVTLTSRLMVQRRAANDAPVVHPIPVTEPTTPAAEVVGDCIDPFGIHLLADAPVQRTAEGAGRLETQVAASIDSPKEVEEHRDTLAIAPSTLSKAQLAIARRRNVRHAHTLKFDPGAFGEGAPDSEAFAIAVAEYQASAGLAVDGIAGAKTCAQKGCLPAGAPHHAGEAKHEGGAHRTHEAHEDAPHADDPVEATRGTRDAIGAAQRAGKSSIDSPKEDALEPSRDTLPIQARAAGPLGMAGRQVQHVAAAGVAGVGASIPHADAIARSFGAFAPVVHGIEAHVGSQAGTAASQIGAEAYATGNHVAFQSAPSLFTAAHEAAHVVQQRAGVQLLGGVGEVGDVYERNADAVAERVVRGESAHDLLTGGQGGSAAVQRSPAAPGHAGPPEKKTAVPEKATVAPATEKGGAGRAAPAGAPAAGSKGGASRPAHPGAGGPAPVAQKPGGVAPHPGAKGAPHATRPPASRVAAARTAPAPASPSAIDTVAALAPAVDARAKSAKASFAETRVHVQQTATAQTVTAREEAGHAATAFEAHGAVLRETAGHGAWEQSTRMIHGAHAAGDAVRASGFGTRAALIAVSGATTASAGDLDAEERADVRAAIGDLRAQLQDELAQSIEQGANQLAFAAVGAGAALFEAATALWTQIEPELTRASAAARDTGEQLAALLEQQAASVLAAIDALDSQVSAVFDRARGGAAAAASCQPGRDGPSVADRARYARGLAALDELVGVVGAGLGDAASGFEREGEASIAQARGAYTLTDAEFSTQIGTQTAALIAGWHKVADEFLGQAGKFSHDAIRGHAALLGATATKFRDVADKVVEASRRSLLGDVWSAVKSAGEGLLVFAALVLIGAALILAEFPAMALAAVFALAVSVAALTMAVTGLMRAALDRGKQAAEANQGKPWYRQILGQVQATAVAAGDAFGATPLVEGAFGRDMLTNEKLDEHEQVRRTTSGLLGLLTGRLMEEGVSRLPTLTPPGRGPVRSVEHSSDTSEMTSREPQPAPTQPPRPGQPTSSSTAAESGKLQPPPARSEEPAQSSPAAQAAGRQPARPEAAPDAKLASRGASPGGRAVEIVKAHGGSVRKAVADLNQLGLKQEEMVEALEAAWKSTGRDTAGWLRAQDGTIVLLSRRVGPHQPVNLIRPSGLAEFGEGELYVDHSPTTKSPINVRGVTAADGTPLPMPGEVAVIAVPSAPSTAQQAPGGHAPDEAQTTEPRAPAHPTQPQIGDRARRLDELARDPDHGGKVTDATRREAQVALDLEQQGQLVGPVRRPTPGDGHSGDFVDGAGGDWDVKAPKSRQSIISNARARAAAEGRKQPNMDPSRPIPGEFVVETLMKQIQKELAAGERVIIDTEGLATADLELLKAEVAAAGLDGQVVFHE